MNFRPDLHELCDEPGKQAIILFLTHYYDFLRDDRWEYHEVHWRLGYFTGDTWPFDTVRWPKTYGRIQVLQAYTPLYCWCPNKKLTRSIVMKGNIVLAAPQYRVKTKRSSAEEFYHVPVEQTKTVDLCVRR